MKQTTLFESAGAPPTANLFANTRPLTRCDVCGSERFGDRRIHGGTSTIRECARCRRFMGFPRWYGQEGPRP